MQCSSARIPRAWFVSLVLVVVSLSGCLFSNEAPTAYYLLSYGGDNAVSTEGSSAAPRFDALVVVEEALVSPLYSRRQIVQRLQPPEILLLTRNLWAVSPSDAVQEAIFDHVRHRGIFADVVRSARIREASYRIRSLVNKLEYRCCETTPTAVFDIEILLLDPEDKVVARYAVSARDEVEGSLTEFVLAVNRRLTEAIDGCVAEVESIAP